MGRDETGFLGRIGRAGWDESAARGAATLALARPRHALGAALRDSLGLIGPQRPLPAPLAAGMAHGIEEHRRVLRER